MLIRRLMIRVAIGAAAVPFIMAGCMSTSGDVQGARLTDNFKVYAPFDNERDGGPNYLVGAPSRPGDESRMDGTQSPPTIPQSAAPSPADPKGPPLSDAPQINNGSGPQSSSAPPAPPQPLP